MRFPVTTVYGLSRVVYIYIHIRDLRAAMAGVSNGTAQEVRVRDLFEC